MGSRLFLLLLAVSLAACATSRHTLSESKSGLIEMRSTFDVAETTSRLQAALDKAGMTQFAVIDHAAGAQSVGLPLGPTRVVIFGNPKAGTPLMQCAQTVGIDLPMKALIYENAQGEVWYVYNDPVYLASRHAIEGCDAVIDKVSGALSKFASAATGG
ncbi:MAG: DUF302 domain-containing protein [Pseudomonadota bacterium]